jgi:hypothetical protein
MGVAALPPYKAKAGSLVTAALFVTGEVETVQLQGALAREVRRMRTLGWVDPRWSEALRHLAGYLEQAGWELASGRWVVAEPLLPLPACARPSPSAGPADRAAEPSAWELGLSAEVAARLCRALQRLRRRPPA